MMTTCQLPKTKVSLLHDKAIGTTVRVCGWVRTVRKQSQMTFVEVNDGSSLKSVQVVTDGNEAEALTTGSAVDVTGILAQSPGLKQAVELRLQSIKIVGTCPSDYPLQKKRHSFEFLREIAHLRPRTNSIGAVARVRNALSFATHTFFQNRGFSYVHTPIITASDCEGAGELFRVTTLDLEKMKGPANFQDDFFGSPAYLTCSGQLNAEIYALALGDVYTFGPTFRAENSNTSRHLAEFWMIEPEIAFADLRDDMELAESYVKFCLKAVFERCEEELHLFDQFISPGLKGQLKTALEEPFATMSYTDAVETLLKSGKNFEFEVKWGEGLQAEHERFLSEEHAKRPVIVYDYPDACKAFYMRINADEKTVAAMDMLVPRIGELIGGSQREERYDVLKSRILAKGLPLEAYDWYLQLRKYGTAPHAGFGLGFERLVQYCTGMENIRDCIPFPRYPRHATF